MTSGSRITTAGYEFTYILGMNYMYLTAELQDLSILDDSQERGELRAIWKMDVRQYWKTIGELSDNELSHYSGLELPNSRRM
jgi:hypothetical protein